MIEESSIYQNVDTVYTIPIKKAFVNGVLGLGFMGKPNLFLFCFPFSEIQIW